jgi:hypothetical protein
MKTDLQIEVNGKKHEVSIDESGTFSINMGSLGGSSQIIRAPSYDELRKKARKIKIPFELKFTEAMRNTTRDGTVTGIHATNGNILVRWEPEMIAGRPAPARTEQLPGYQSGQFMPRLSEKDAEALRYLISERNRAAQELENFTKPRAWSSLSKAARDAQAAAAEGEKS